MWRWHLHSYRPYGVSHELVRTTHPDGSVTTHQVTYVLRRCFIPVCPERQVDELGGTWTIAQVRGDGSGPALRGTPSGPRPTRHRW